MARKPLEQGGALEQVGARIERVMGLTPRVQPTPKAVGWNERLEKMVIRTGLFFDDRRGNGWHISAGSWTFAVRRRWRIYFVRPPGKPGYSRLYVGPFEIEHRPTF